jgi:hypothetical protein
VPGLLLLPYLTDTQGGRLFGYVYDPGLAGLDELAGAAHAISAPVNGLDPTAFPSLLAMENARWSRRPRGCSAVGRRRWAA